MYSRALVFLLLAMARIHGTMSFVFGPLAAFTTPQDTSASTASPSTTQWPVDADVTTPVTRRRPIPNNRPRPNPAHGSSNIVFPSANDNHFPSFSTPNNYPIQNPQDAKENEGFIQDHQTDNTDRRLAPEFTPRPLRPKQSNHGLADAIMFDGPTSSHKSGGIGRVRPTRPPLLFPPANIVWADTASDMEDMASPPPPCMCPTTSESNPICAEVQGQRVTMYNLSEFKCAQICVGSSVKLIFHGTCQRSITKLHPFIHD